MQYKPYIPRNIGEFMDQLSYMMLYSPTFKDKTGYFPHHNIDTAYYSLNEGLLAVRKNPGEERYAALKVLSDRMRALFEADPDDTTGDTHAGRMLIHEMKDILNSAARPPAPK
jgi:hypothetical protein